VVICLELGADLHTVQLMPLPVTVSCFSKIQIGFTFLVPAHPGSPGQRAVCCHGIFYSVFLQLTLFVRSVYCYLRIVNLCSLAVVSDMDQPGVNS